MQWFELTLKQKQIPAPKIRYYVPGRDCWQETDSWEELKRQTRVLYLDAATPSPKIPADAIPSPEALADAIPSPEASADATPVSGCVAGTLTQSPNPNTSSVSYTFDPANPVPTHGGDCTLHSWNATGSLRQPEPGYRQDVRTFLSDPIEEELILNGRIDVELWVKSDCQDTAFFRQYR